MSNAPFAPPADEELIPPGMQLGASRSAWWQRTWVWLLVICILGGSAYFYFARPEGGKPPGMRQPGGSFRGSTLMAMRREPPVRMRWRTPSKDLLHGSRSSTSRHRSRLSGAATTS